MLDEEDYGSDTSDDDYRPSDGEAVSEEEASGEEEDTAALCKDAGDDADKPKKKRRKKTDKSLASPRKRCGGIQLEDGENKTAEEGDAYNQELQKEVEKEKEEKKETNDKQHADDLWASFMSDVGKPNKSKPTAAASGLGSLGSVVKSSPGRPANTAPSPAAVSKPAALAKVTITKEYDFAGETVRVTKEVDVNSKEAKAQEDKTPTTPRPGLTGLKRPSGGLGSVLGKIEKKSKISTLDKSKLDWEQFKSAEGIDEELQIHNRGKSGYVEQQQFLQRADVRQFELERDMRLKTSKR